MSYSVFFIRFVLESNIKFFKSFFIFIFMRSWRVYKNTCNINTFCVVLKAKYIIYEGRIIFKTSYFFLSLVWERGVQKSIQLVFNYARLNSDYLTAAVIRSARGSS